MNKSTDETAAMDRHDEPYKSQLQRIGQAIGYGRAQPAAPADAAPSVAPEPLHVDETKRYRVVQKGYWWRVQIGDGQQTVGRCFSQTEAQHLAHALVVAYRDGFFVASLSAHPPRAPLTPDILLTHRSCYSESEWAVFVGGVRFAEMAHGIGGK